MSSQSNRNNQNSKDTLTDKTLPSADSASNKTQVPDENESIYNIYDDTISGYTVTTPNKHKEVEISISNKVSSNKANAKKRRSYSSSSNKSHNIFIRFLREFLPETLNAWRFLFTNQRVALISLFTLLFFGLIVLKSASIGVSAYYYGSESHDLFFNKQLLAIGLGIVLFVVFYSLPVDEFWRRFRYLALILSFLILVLVLLIGKEVNSARRWISIGPLQIQAIEVVKLSFFVYIAGFLEKLFKNTYVKMMQLGLILSILIFLIILQPDYKSAMYMLLIMGIVLFLNRVNIVLLGSSLLMVLIVGGVLLFIEDYRVTRLVDFFQSFLEDGQGGYQYTNALYAIQRGGLFGTGWTNSIQKYGYLPESHNDFIFSVMIEEWGAIFAVCFFIAYCFFILYFFFRISSKLYSRGHVYIANLGWLLSLALLLNAYIHVLVNIGWVPVTGISFPFLSYGGSLTFMSLGILGILFRISYEYNKKYASKLDVF